MGAISENSFWYPHHGFTFVTIHAMKDRVVHVGNQVMLVIVFLLMAFYLILSILPSSMWFEYDSITIANEPVVG